MIKKFKILYSYIILFCLLIFSLEYTSQFYMSIAKACRFFTAFIAIFFVIFGLYYWQYNKKNRTLNVYNIFYINIYLGILFHSIIILFSRDHKIFYLGIILIYSQIISAFFFMNLEIKILERFLKIMFPISFIGILFVILSMGKIDINYALKRGYQYKEIFYYAPLCWGSSAFLILSFLKNKNIVYALCYFSLNLLVNTIIVKRLIFFESFVLFIVICLISVFLKNRRKVFFKVVFICIILFLIATILFKDKLLILIESILTRLLESGKDLEHFNRNVESITYFKTASILEIFLGKSFIGVHYGLGEESLALHNGWGNFVLKGGVPLFLLAFIPIIKSIFLLLKVKKLSYKKQFCIFYLIYSFPMFFLSNTHSFIPRMFLFWYCCLNIMNKENYSNERRKYGSKKIMDNFR